MHIYIYIYITCISTHHLSEITDAVHHNESPILGGTRLEWTQTRPHT